MEDALVEFKLELLESNLNPGKVFEFIQKASK
jgi:hypothetical protein